MENDELRRKIQAHPEIQKCSEGPFSRAFLRGRAWINTRTLDTVCYKWIHETHSLVELICNYLLTKDERNEVFPSNYDLGSLQKLNTASTRTARVSEYLKAAYERDPKPLLKSVKEDIKAWTGYDFKDYCEVDNSIATKVLCAIYEFRVLIYPRLTSLLENPTSEDKYSSEFRSAWPVEIDGTSADKARSIVSTISDLKAMMTFQMSREDDDLRRLMLLLQSQFESRTFPDVLSTMKGYRVAKEQSMRRVHQYLPKGPGARVGRLDRVLFVHLTLLEIEHKRYATDALVEFLKTDDSIPALKSLELCREWLYDEGEFDDQTIFGLVADITGVLIEQEDWQSYWNCSTLILSMRFVFRNSATLIERFAALVTLVGSSIQQLEYPIWWKGYTSISRRPWLYLKNAMDSLPRLGVTNAIDSIPYGYREFWTQRYYLIVHRCMEAEEVWSDCNTCESNEIRMVVDMFRSTGIDEAIELASDYIQYKVENSLEQTVKIMEN
ncbi:hypothetical protein JQR84_23675 (plasmid) [Pseudomonas luteola]|uniref:hypothetical protein n=1 Tax=Pseudomonas TaxID=286 RepID=UPI003DA0F417